jgi:putative peptide zinc metalloprotease protein
VEQVDTISLPARIALLRRVPTFVPLPPSAFQSLATSLREECFELGEVVLREGESGDRLYVLFEGQAEATTASATGPVVLEAYGPDEVFGELALITPDHTRQATVTAVSDLRALSLQGEVFRSILTASPEAHAHLAQLEERLHVIKFLKAASPFTKLDLDQLRRLADQLTPVSVQPGDAIVRQGEHGDACYLLRTGTAVVMATADDGAERELATLHPGTVIGEASLLTEAPRNATVRAATLCDLLVLRRSDLLAVVGADRDLGYELVELIQLRDRPKQVEGIIVSRRTSSDGTVITTLKDSRRSHYYRLSPEGYFVWQRLDGNHTLRDLTLEYVVQFKAFAPQAISDAVQGLAAAGFVERKAWRGEVTESAGESPSRWRQLAGVARHMIDWQISLPNPDPWLSRLYRSGAWLLFTWPAQVLLAGFCLVGLIVLSANLGTAAHATRGGGWVLLLFFVMYFLMIVLHESGHAFTVKFYGREVPRVGVGWYWFGPIAYADTSDMWLADRRQRVIVTLGGLYGSLLVASASAIIAVLIGSSVLALMLWQLAFFSAYTVLLNLNPLLELDGYFILMDVLDRPNLRQHCLSWLGNDFPMAVRDRRELGAHKLELLYGVGAVVYVVFSAFLLLVVFRPVVAGWFGHITPSMVAAAIAWCLTGTLVALTLLTLVGDLRTSRRLARR